MAPSFVLLAIVAACQLALGEPARGSEEARVYIKKIQEVGNYNVNGKSNIDNNQDPVNKCFYEFNAEFARNVADFFVDQYFAYSQFLNKADFDQKYNEIVRKSAAESFYPVASDINAFSRVNYNNIDEAARMAEESVKKGQRRYFRSFDKFYKCVDQASRDDK